jgi:hypothetical protein
MYQRKGKKMDSLDIRDEWSCLQCGQCKHFKAGADREGIESTCKRLDHKHIKFAKPWFKSYDCGQFFGTVCRDFEPAAYCVWLCKHWKGFDDYFAGEEFKGTVALVLDSDFSVRYKVKAIDFINNTFLDEEGNLKWIEKEYYKISRKSPIGYALIHEKRA